MVDCEKEVKAARKLGSISSAGCIAALIEHWTMASGTLRSSGFCEGAAERKQRKSSCPVSAAVARRATNPLSPLAAGGSSRRVPPARGPSQGTQADHLRRVGTRTQHEEDRRCRERDWRAPERGGPASARGRAKDAGRASAFPPTAPGVLQPLQGRGSPSKYANLPTPSQADPGVRHETGHCVARLGR
eukprot:scaffold141986_cov29-Tisochrysis_lutea.AAC.4